MAFTARLTHVSGCTQTQVRSTAMLGGMDVERAPVWLLLDNGHTNPPCYTVAFKDLRNGAIYVKVSFTCDTRDSITSLTSEDQTEGRLQFCDAFYWDDCTKNYEEYASIDWDYVRSVARQYAREQTGWPLVWPPTMRSCILRQMHRLFSH